MMILEVGERLKQVIRINRKYITLGQLLKAEAVVQTGGRAKWYLKQNAVTVNRVPETRRGRKLYPGDVVSVPNVGVFIVRLKRKPQ